jgi:hypothetical protein
MPRSAWTQVAGRRVRVFTRTIQSVNLCDATNCNGKYERRFYFSGSRRITAADLVRFTDLASLVRWLERRSYREASA